VRYSTHYQALILLSVITNQLYTKKNKRKVQIESADQQRYLNNCAFKYVTAF